MKTELLLSLGGGVNHAGARAYNEKLILSLLRRNGSLSKAELARLTGLTAQALSIIIKRLEVAGFVLAKAAIKGKIGQPQVPYQLNSESVYSIGVKIGRRSTEVQLINFTGEVKAEAALAYDLPMMFVVKDYILTAIKEMQKDINVIGVGVAMPFEIWNWVEVIGVTPDALKAWQNFDVCTEILHETGLPALLSNDATAACAAELNSIPHDNTLDFVYFFIGWFVGGGVVLNGKLVSGRNGNAGALGSMLVSVKGETRQLIEFASLNTLEKRVVKAGFPRDLLNNFDNWRVFETVLNEWLDDSALALAQASLNCAATIDFSEIHIDGALPVKALERLIAKTKTAYESLNRQGISALAFKQGQKGASARVYGAAMLPILANFTSDLEVVTKDVA